MSVEVIEPKKHIKIKDKQQDAIEVMLNHTYSLLFGGSRCLSSETLVLTDIGYKKISNINIGDNVPSLQLDGSIKNKKVTNIYKTEVNNRLKVITFVFINNTKITCSYEHKFLFNGKYTRAVTIAKRAMERNNRYKWEIQNLKHGKIGIYEQIRCGWERRKLRVNEPSTRWMWLFKDYDNCKWEKQDNKNAQSCWRIFYSKYRKKTSDKSQKSSKIGQQSRKFGMGNPPRKYRLYDGSWSSICKLWRKVWNSYINRRTSSSNTERVQAKSYYKKNVGREIWSRSYYDKGYNSGKELEASEINISLLKHIEVSDYFEPLYDIEVQDSHNFFITEQNIISHNSGKSFIIMFQMLFIANKYKCRQLIVRFHFTEIKKSIIRETLPEVAELMGITYNLNQQDWFATLPNGSEIWFGGIDEGRGLDRVLGKQYLNIWFNEASDIQYAAYTTVLTRLAERVLRKDKFGKPMYLKKPDGTWEYAESGNRKRAEVMNRVFIDENPPKKSHWTYKIFFDNIEPESRMLLSNPDDYGVIQLNPNDNKENISEGYIRRLEAMPPKQRKRFLLGEFSDDISGALFTESLINKYRDIKHPNLKQIVVSIDPATTSKSTSDETGITVEGKCYEDRGYLLEDKSGIYKPNEWAAIACKLFYKYDADYIVAEINQGGEMVKATINNYDKNVPVKTVHATKGKLLRAEPISFLYEEGRITHVGSFPDAEDEMVSYTGAAGEKSPNRLDSIVHGFTFLFPIGKSADAEYFNRDKVKFFELVPGNEIKTLGLVVLTGVENYSFSMLVIQVSGGKSFLIDVLFNDYRPEENIPEIEIMIKLHSIEKIFIECNLSYSPFVREIYNKKLCSVRGLKENTDNDNRILIESASILNTFHFKKEPESIQYKDFMRQLNSYTSVADKDECFAPNALSCASEIIKKLYR